MKIQIRLDENSNIGSLINSEPFLLVDNQTFEIEFIGAENKVLLATLKNGNMQKQMLVYNNKLSIPNDFIIEGEIKIIVAQYNDTLKRKWHCEPIKIIRPQEEIFEGYSLIKELSAEIAELRSAIQVLANESAESKNQIKQLWELHEV